MVLKYDKQFFFGIEPHGSFSKKNQPKNVKKLNFLLIIELKIILT